ncbi:hypothetical protein Taro_014952 [Colocasia esculenta]|uniref:DUF7866 domain-containing protein n=1 Tax=Colocasia esculenta TaxID=4460 RepID=A0A843UAB8_COLES|nr:hypothetical protein [Colocasia esculenta]
MATIPKPAALALLFLTIFALAFTSASSSVALTAGSPLLGEETVGALAVEGGRAGGANVQYVPVEPVEYRRVDAVTRGSRMLAPFQQCRDCRCCEGGNPEKCSNMPCCYTLVCDIPGKPPGTCAIIPKACNCNGCA